MRKNKTFLKYFVFTAWFCFCFAGSVFGSNSFNVANFDFSNPAQTPGNFTTESVPGWTGSWGDQHIASAYGVWDPIVGTNLNYMPNGATQVAYLSASNNMNSSLGQDLSSNGLGNPTIAADTTYTFSVEVGARSDVAFAYNLMQLYAGGTVIGQIDNFAPSAPGNWRLATITWDSASDPSLVGTDLTVFFVTHQQPTSAFYQILYTDVAVTFTSDITTPEPGSIGLALAGISVLAARRLYARRIGRKFLPE